MKSFNLVLKILHMLFYIDGIVDIDIFVVLYSELQGPRSTKAELYLYIDKNLLLHIIAGSLGPNWPDMSYY